MPGHAGFIASVDERKRGRTIVWQIKVDGFPRQPRPRGDSNDATTVDGIPRQAVDGQVDGQVDGIPRHEQNGTEQNYPPKSPRPHRHRYEHSGYCAVCGQREPNHDNMRLVG